MATDDQTASLMTPAKLAQVNARGPLSPSAFLDQMAADVGHQHLHRLGELRHLLQQEAQGSAAAVVQPSVERLAQALPGIDWGLVEPPGWWAAVRGKGRGAGDQFALSIERMEEAVKAMGGEVAAAQKAQQPHAVAADRLLVECEVEIQALGKIIDQGTRWLQAMRNQIKERAAQAADDPQVAQDEARCEILVGRLKALRDVVAAARQAREQALATAERRSAVTLAVQQALVSEVATWRSRQAKLIERAAQGRTGGALERAREALGQLQQRLAGVLADCEQLRTLEDALDSALAGMGERVAALG